MSEPRHGPSLPSVETAVHLALTAIVAWWSVMMGVAGDSMTANRRLHGLTMLMVPHHWCALLGAAAVAAAVGLVPPLRRLRMACLVLLSLTYSALTVLLSWGTLMSLGTGSYAALSLLAIYLVLQEAGRRE